MLCFTHLSWILYSINSVCLGRELFQRRISGDKVLVVELEIDLIVFTNECKLFSKLIHAIDGVDGNYHMEHDFPSPTIQIVKNFTIISYLLL